MKGIAHQNRIGIHRMPSYRRNPGVMQSRRRICLEALFPDWSHLNHGKYELRRRLDFQQLGDKAKQRRHRNLFIFRVWVLLRRRVHLIEWYPRLRIITLTLCWRCPFTNIYRIDGMNFPNRDPRGARHLARSARAVARIEKELAHNANRMGVRHCDNVLPCKGSKMPDNLSHDSATWIRIEGFGQSDMNIVVDFSQ